MQTRRAGLVIAAAGALALLSPAAARACEIRDSFTDFLALAERTRGLTPEVRLAAFHAEFLPKTAALYTLDVIGLAPGPKLDARAAKTMAAIDAHPQWAAYDAQLHRALPEAEAKFRAAFPDFRCDFPIYLAPTFGQMDAGGRIIDGRPALVFGVDAIATFDTPEQLPVLLTHELFHRYQAQAADIDDDDVTTTTLWKTLWAEGLATYVSARLNPDRPLAEAFLLPHELETRAAPLLPRLARGLAAELDKVDPAAEAKYFQYGTPSAPAEGLPWRSGYYVGYRVAKDLARTHSLQALAHLKGDALRRDIGESLGRLAAAPPAP